jgi:hypothetical protein
MDGGGGGGPALVFFVQPSNDDDGRRTRRVSRVTVRRCTDSSNIAMLESRKQMYEDDTKAKGGQQPARRISRCTPGLGLRHGHHSNRRGFTTVRGHRPAMPPHSYSHKGGDGKEDAGMVEFSFVVTMGGGAAMSSS